MLCSQTPKTFGGCTPRPLTTPKCLSYNSLLNMSPSQIFSFFNSKVTSPFSKVLVNCLQPATALDLPFYNIFAPQKVPLLKISNDIIECNSWFGPSQSKILATHGYLRPVTVTSDVIGQSYVRLLFGLELVLVIIRVGAKFRL